MSEGEADRLPSAIRCEPNGPSATGGMSVGLPPAIRRALEGPDEAARTARGDAPLLVALSGGADSTALLRALVRVRAARGAKPPYGLAAAHLNHDIRGAEADGDAAFCVALCESLGVPLSIGRANVPAEAARTGESLEMAARRKRRSFLRAAAKRQGATAVALGHTLDDQLELFLLRLARGAGLRGLAGMPPAAPFGGDALPRLLLVRPFLSLRHADLVAFLRAEDLPWREDSTNARDDALRNRIRHRAVPALLEACGAGLPATLGRTLSLLREDADFLDGLAAAGEPWASGDPARALADGPAPVARRRVARALYAAGADPEAVSLAAVERVRALAAGGRNGQIPVGGGLAARLDYGRLTFVREEPPPPAPFVVPPGDAQPDLAAAGGLLRIEAARSIERPPRGDFLARPVSCTVRADALAGRALALRPWRAGDRIAAAGGRGTRKLSDVFADAKLPRADRARVLVLADAATGAVLWLPGHGVAREIAVRPGDGILRLTLAAPGRGPTRKRARKRREA